MTAHSKIRSSPFLSDCSSSVIATVVSFFYLRPQRKTHSIHDPWQSRACSRSSLSRRSGAPDIAKPHWLQRDSVWTPPLLRKSARVKARFGGPSDGGVPQRAAEIGTQSRVCIGLLRRFKGEKSAHRASAPHNHLSPFGLERLVRIDRHRFWLLSVLQSTPATSNIAIKSSPDGTELGPLKLRGRIPADHPFRLPTCAPVCNNP